METLRILLVEDDEDDFVVTRGLLAEIPDLEIALDWAQSYEGGLDRVGSSSYGLCLIDHNLGSSTGVEFLRELRQINGAPPAILLTGAASRDVDLAAMEAGASDFLNKAGLTSALLDRSIRYTAQKQRAAEAQIDLAVERAARAAAEEANRAKDQFLARLSHELRTPMAPILGISSLLEIDEKLPAGVREQLHVVRRNAEVEARLIDDLLDLTRINRGAFALNREVVDLERLVKEAIETAVYATTEADTRRLVLDFAAEETRVWGDPIRLIQALCNLLTNAVRYTPKGGTVTVRSRRQEPEGIVIEVRDDGRGFDPQDAPRLFDAFERAGLPEGGGLGLGLWIARSIIEDHGGILSAHSEGVGQGASFFVFLSTILPAGANEATATQSANPLLLQPKPSANGTGTAERPLHILLVEDHLDTAFAISHLLTRLGHKVTHADNPEAALAAVAASADPPVEFVVSDLWLRSGSGLDLMPELARRYGLRGIAISGLGGDGAIARSRAAGFARHLTKPINFVTLRDAIREVNEVPA